LTLNLRAATQEDVESIIDLMLMSSWGGMRAAWERVSKQGENWRDRARAEVADLSSDIGYPHCVLAVDGSRPLGLMLLNNIGDTRQLDTRGVPPIHVGPLELMKLASNSLFVRELAVVEQARGKGIASTFLEFALQVGRSHDVPRVTLMVNDANGSALKLYERKGYRRIAERPSIDHPFFPEGSMLLLMEAQIFRPRDT
jgi:ribosomal protein S18 acetylase RimI-like enzyme